MFKLLLKKGVTASGVARILIRGGPKVNYRREALEKF